MPQQRVPTETTTRFYSIYVPALCGLDTIQSFRSELVGLQLHRTAQDHVRLTERLHFEVYSSLDRFFQHFSDRLDELLVRVQIQPHDVHIYGPDPAWEFYNFLILHTWHAHLLQSQLVLVRHTVFVQVLCYPVPELLVGFRILDQLYVTDVRDQYTRQFRSVAHYLATLELGDGHLYRRLVDGDITPL